MLVSKIKFRASESLKIDRSVKFVEFMSNAENVIHQSSIIEAVKNIK